MNRSRLPGTTPGPAIMRTLVAKDLRLYRAQIVALAVVGFASYLISIVADHKELHHTIAEAAEAGSPSAYLLTAVIVSALGGAAIAGERSDDTIDFVAMLPVSRGQIVLSKWIASLWIMVIAVTVQVAISLLLGTIIGRYQTADIPLRKMSEHGALWFGGMVALFGVSFLCSTMTRSAVASAGMSILVPVGLVSFIEISRHNPGFEQWLLRWENVEGAAAFVTGFLSLAAGGLYYLRRVKP